MRCNVEVTGKDNRLLLVDLQLLEIVMEVSIPLVDAIAQALESLTCVWHIRGDEHELFEFHRDRSTFINVLLAEVELDP